MELSHCICLSGILSNSVFKIGNNYYPQVFPNKCKYIANEKDVTRYIADDLEISSDDLYKENSVEKD